MAARDFSRHTKIKSLIFQNEENNVTGHAVNDNEADTGGLFHFIQQLEQPDKEIRWNAIFNLARLGDRQAIPALLRRITDDPDDVVRIAALHAVAILYPGTDLSPLRRLNNPAAGKYLKVIFFALIEDVMTGHFHPIYTAVVPQSNALHPTPDTSIPPYVAAKQRSILCAIIQNLILNDENDTLKIMMKMITGYHLESLLDEFHQNTQLLSTDEAHEIYLRILSSKAIRVDKVKSIQAISQTQDPDWASFLLQLINEPRINNQDDFPSYRPIFSRALQDMHDVLPQSEFLALLSAENPEIRKIAWETMGMLKKPEYIPLLRTHLANGDVDIAQILSRDFKVSPVAGLGQIVSNETLPIDQRRQAFQSLNRTWTPETVAILRDYPICPIYRQVRELIHNSVWRLYRLDLEVLFNRRSEILYQTLDEAHAFFRQPFPRSAYAGLIRPVIQDLVDDFLYSTRRDKTPMEQLEMIYFWILPRRIESLLQERLPNGLMERLYLFLPKVDNLFHLLQDTQLFRQSVPPEIFSIRAKKYLGKVLQKMPTGQLDFCLRYFPLDMLRKEFSDVLPVVNYGSQCGYDSFFEAFKSAVEPFGISVHWHYTASAHQLQYSVGQHNWKVDQVNSINDPVNYNFFYQFQEIEIYLANLGYRRFPLATGDQTSASLILPIAQIERFRPFLFETSDPRYYEPYSCLHEDYIRDLPTAVEVDPLENEG